MLRHCIDHHLHISQPGLLLAQLVNAPASVYRFGFDANRNLVEQQKTTDLGGNAHSTSVSGDGQHLAIAAGSGNGAGYTIHNLDPADFSMAGE